MIEYRVRRFGNCWPHDEVWYDSQVQDQDQLINIVTGLNNRSINPGRYKFKEKLTHKGLSPQSLCIVKAEA